jgi:hypothetical protein
MRLTLTRLKVLGKDKHSSLILKNINDEENFLIALGPDLFSSISIKSGAYTIKLFTVVINTTVACLVSVTTYGLV